MSRSHMKPLDDAPADGHPVEDRDKGIAADPQVSNGHDQSPPEQTTDLLLQPNRADISKHLYTLFPHALVAPYPDCWIEIAVASKATDWKPNTAEHFSPFDLKKAVDYAEKANKPGVNIYVGASLRQGKTGPSGRSTDVNFQASAYAWADFDGAGDLDRVSGTMKANKLVNAMLVVTGTVPHKRAHPYFKLAGTVTAEQMKAVNIALKTLLGTDNVENPCRLMRLGGTVSYPWTTR